MKLKQKFLNYFSTIDEVRTKEILEWYTAIKDSDNLYTHHTSIYQLINQLIAEKHLIREARGLYKINKLTQPQPLVAKKATKATKETKEEETPTKQENQMPQEYKDFMDQGGEYDDQDEFDKYIDAKIKGGEA